MHAADLVMDVTEVDTSATAPLGQLYFEPATSQASVTTVKPPANSGPRTWVYVFNDDTPAFAAGEVIMRDASTTTYDGLVTSGSTPAIRVLGVAQHAIAAGSYGWILKRGLGELAVEDTGANQDDTALVSAAAGRVDSMVGGEEHEVIAWATESAAATAGALLTAWINCPG
tara:strand:+ start:1207 stop:1719 length:513 start_codon:yes stop_codon:yes gene_type:complete